MDPEEREPAGTTSHGPDESTKEETPPTAEGDDDFLKVLETSEDTDLQIATLENLCMDILLNPDDTKERFNFVDVLLPPIFKLITRPECAQSVMEPALRLISYLSQEEQQVVYRIVQETDTYLASIRALLVAPDLSNPQSQAIMEHVVQILVMLVDREAANLTSFLSPLIHLLLNENISLMHPSVIKGICSVVGVLCSQTDNPTEEMYALLNHENEMIRTRILSAMKCCRYHFKEIAVSDVFKISRLFPVLLNDLDGRSVEILKKLCGGLTTLTNFAKSVISKNFLQSTHLPVTLKAVSSPETGIPFVYLIAGLLGEFATVQDCETLVPICLRKVCEWPRLASLATVKKLVPLSGKWSVIEEAGLEGLTNILDQALSPESGKRSILEALAILRELIALDRKNALAYARKQEYSNKLNVLLKALQLDGKRCSSTEFSLIHSLWSEFEIEAIVDRPWIVAGFCVVKTANTCHIWSNKLAIELWKGSNGWFMLYVNDVLYVVYSSGLIKACSTNDNDDASDNFRRRLNLISHAASRTFYDQMALRDPNCTTDQLDEWKVAKTETGGLIVTNHATMTELQLEGDVAKVISASGVTVKLPSAETKLPMVDTDFISSAHPASDRNNVISEVLKFLHDFPDEPDVEVDTVTADDVTLLDEIGKVKAEVKDTDAALFRNVVRMMKCKKKQLGPEFDKFLRKNLTEKQLFNLKCRILPFVDRCLDCQLSDSAQDQICVEQDVFALLMPATAKDFPGDYQSCKGYSLSINSLNAVLDVKRAVAPLISSMWCRQPRSNLSHCKRLKESGTVDLSSYGVLHFYATDDNRVPPISNLVDSGLIALSHNATVMGSGSFLFHLPDRRPSSGNSEFYIEFDIKLPLTIRRYRFRANALQGESLIDKWTLSGSDKGNLTVLDERAATTEMEEFEIKQNGEEKSFSVFRVTLFINWRSNCRSLVYDFRWTDFEFYGTLKYVESAGTESSCRRTFLRRGDRVVRGRDWNWGDQDGFGPGTVVNDTSSPGWVRVWWDRNHATNSYRMDETYQDLKLLKSNRRRRRRSVGQRIDEMPDLKAHNYRNLFRGTSFTFVPYKAKLEIPIPQKVEEEHKTEPQTTTEPTYVDGLEAEENRQYYYGTDCEEMSGEEAYQSQEDIPDTGSEPATKLKQHKKIREMLCPPFDPSTLIASEDSRRARVIEQSKLLYRDNPSSSENNIRIRLSCPELTKLYDSNDADRTESYVTEVEWKGPKSSTEETDNRDSIDFSLELQLSYKNAMFKHRIKLEDESKTLLYYLIQLYMAIHEENHCAGFFEAFRRPTYRLFYTLEPVKRQQETTVGNPPPALTTDDESILLMEELANLTNNEAVCPCLQGKVERQLKCHYLVFADSIPGWCKTAIERANSCVDLDQRLYYFYCTSFGVGSAIMEMQSHSFIANDNFVSKTERYRISRENIFIDACECLRLTGKKRINVDFAFEGEEGIGIGPTTEAFQLIAIAFRQKSLAMWLTDDDCGDELYCELGLFPAPYPRGSDRLNVVTEHFMSFGRFIARCLLGKRTIDMTMSIAFAKLICSEEPLTAEDMRYVDRVRWGVFEMLNSGQEKEIGDHIDQLCLSMEFNPPSRVYGYDNISFTDEGQGMLSYENREQYIEATVNVMFGDGISEQIRAFREGMSELIPLERLRCFKPEEFVRLLHGDCNLQWTMEELRRCVTVKGGYRNDSFEYNALLDVLLDFDIDDRKQFVQFVTGARILPPGGLSKLEPLISVSRRDEGGYPSVNTCMHNLKLPPCQTSTSLREMLMTSMYYAQGFDFN